MLPYPLRSFYSTYYAPYTPYLHPVLTRTYLLLQSTFYTTIYPILYPLYTIAISRLNYEVKGTSTLSPTDTAPVLSIAITLIGLYISLWFLNILRRRLFALASLLINLLFYTAIVFLGVYVYYRGVEGTVDDVQLLLELLGSLEKQGHKRGQRIAGQRSWEAQRKGWGPSGQAKASGRYRYR